MDTLTCSHCTFQIYKADITLHLHTTCCRRKLNDAAHVPQTDRAETRLSLFIYFCSFLVMKIYDRAFAGQHECWDDDISAERPAVFSLSWWWFRSVSVERTSMCLKWGGASAVAAFWLVRALCARRARAKGSLTSSVITGSESGCYQKWLIKQML